MSAGKGLRETGREFPDLSPARCYIVGGAVRDELLGLPVKDRDYVVVGSTAAAMRARGFKPVGRDFPVFLHPQTHEEYALARTGGDARRRPCATGSHHQRHGSR